MAEFIGPGLSFFMSKIIFNKYQVRADNYHWQQISRNIFCFNAFVVARYQQVVDLLPHKKDQKFLDIGCGDGVLLSLIKKGKLYGVDLDQDSLNFASTKIQAKLIKAKAEKLPFKNNFFDVVIATEIIEHLSRPQLMLQEIKRVLKPGGKIIITTPLKSISGLTDLLHVREFSPAELSALISAKFKLIKIYQTHPYWLKQQYSRPLFKVNRLYFEPFRWLINGFVLLTGFNPFTLSSPHSCQIMAVGKKI